MDKVLRVFWIKHTFDKETKKYRKEKAQTDFDTSITLDEAKKCLHEKAGFPPVDHNPYYRDFAEIISSTITTPRVKMMVIQKSDLQLQLFDSISWFSTFGEKK